MDRDSVVARAAELLADAAFRRKLRVATHDGTHPIVPALLSDRLIDVVRHVHDEWNGYANVIVPINSLGMWILSISVTASEPQLWGFPELSPSITIGVLLARGLEDGTIGSEVTYTIPDVGGLSQGSEVARTQLVGLAP